MGGLALGVGTVLNFAGDRDVGTAAGHWVVLVAHVALVFFFTGAFIAHGERARGAIAWGSALAVIGSVMLGALVALELAVTVDVVPDLEAIEGEGALAPLTVIGPLCELAGLVILGVGGLRAKVLASPGWFALIAGAVLALGALADLDVLFAAGGVIAGGGIAALGWGLATSHRGREVLA